MRDKLKRAKWALICTVHNITKPLQNSLAKRRHRLGQTYLDRLLAGGRSPRSLGLFPPGHGSIALLWGRTLLPHDLCLVVIVAEQSSLNLTFSTALRTFFL